MWQYSVCRTVAERLGYDWGINPSPTHDYFKGMNQMYFMDVDFGNQNINKIINEFHENWLIYEHDGMKINVTMIDPRIWEIEDNTRLIGHNGAFGGIYQTEQYFKDNKEEVLNWFRIKPEYSTKYDDKLKELGIVLDENLCVINFRGGEYRSIPHVVCRKEYWRDSINYMLQLNANMKFIVITDDPEFSRLYMPFPIETFHYEIGFDFYVLNQSKWSIISNSTFGWWSSWLNVRANKIIAPKYFGAHNNSDGYWSVGEIYSEKFYYMDRDGNITDYKTCKNEAIKYYKDNNLK